MKSTDFDSLLQSVDEARRHARGEAVAGLKSTSHMIERSEVASVRIKAGLTQRDFAALLGASLGTVRKWELGERSPSGAAATLLRVLDADPSAITRALGLATQQPARPRRVKLVAAE